MTSLVFNSRKQLRPQQGGIVSCCWILHCVLHGGSPDQQVPVISVALLRAGTDYFASHIQLFSSSTIKLKGSSYQKKR